MKKIRAIYIGDVRHNECPVFELNEETGWFEMLSDRSFSYEKECVYDDKTFLIFLVNGEEVDMLKCVK